MLTDDIRKELFRLQDTQYRDFQAKLIPNMPPDGMIGVRTPDLRKFAKQMVKQDKADGFLRELPHRYFDENQLHAFILSELKDFAECGLCGTAAVISPVGKVVGKDETVEFPSGMEKMGPVTQKLYDTLRGIQLGTILIAGQRVA